MNHARSDTDSDGASSSEEDVDSGIAEEVSTEARKEVDCMDLSEFFGYWERKPTSSVVCKTKTCMVFSRIPSSELDQIEMTIKKELSISVHPVESSEAISFDDMDPPIAFYNVDSSCIAVNNMYASGTPWAIYYMHSTEIPIYYMHSTEIPIHDMDSTGTTIYHVNPTIVPINNMDAPSNQITSAKIDVGYLNEKN